jgi:hydroxyacylglutathione hydrolase
VRALIRVGLDTIVGYITPQTLAEFARSGGRLSRTETIDMAQMETRRTSGEARVLDVRGGAEFDLGHVTGAIHIPHTRVPLQLDTLPRDLPLLVQCNSGARAAAAVSLLERHGFQAVQVNDLFANYQQSDLNVGVNG